jgi:two-component system, chemotaxis family, CheB/CheR fusion protein
MEILSRLKPDNGMAYIVAQHRAPTQPELLRGILARVTDMPVCEIEQGMRIQPDRVYVMPPRTEVTLADHTFILRSAPVMDGWPKTITTLMRSLALAMGRQAVAVILSGLDSDGAKALKTVKAAGGITMAQKDASYDSMPRSAIETGRIDHVLSAHEIADALNRLADNTVLPLQHRASRMLI